LVCYVGIYISVKKHASSVGKPALHLWGGSVAVFSEKKGYKLRMYRLVVAEVSAQEAADEVPVDRSVIAWKMYVFDCSEKLLEILPESFDLCGFTCTVQAFQYY
jgi:hypothetical protein